MRFIWRAFIFVLYCLILAVLGFFSTSLNGVAEFGRTWVSSKHFDKILHFLAFCGLYGMLQFLFGRQVFVVSRSFQIKRFSGGGGSGVLEERGRGVMAQLGLLVSHLAFPISLVCALASELVQGSLPHRVFDLMDVVANVLGILFGLLVHLILNLLFCWGRRVNHRRSNMFFSF